MKQELSHSLEILKGQPTPPYFLSYEISESRSAAVTGAFGTIHGSSEDRSRQLDIDLRVGDYQLDNTHSSRGGSAMLEFADRFSLIEIPIEDDPDAIRSVLWYHTDRKYKRAVERLTNVKTNVQVKVEQQDKSADFSEEPPETHVEKPVTVNVDRRVWE